MLALALGATLVAFVLLVLGLVTGTVWLAISCIVVCLAGLGFLMADVVGSARRAPARSVEQMVGGASSAGRRAGATTPLADDSRSGDEAINTGGTTVRQPSGVQRGAARS
ncbi:MAG TPA: hypothetical protein PLC22_17950, partial [Gordonia sp. (in: high G+C Gram-positive bacteria)]|nr:hypothetical protein [Gordonia sp. (in: high G+C Gram-positive bacteria)]